MDGSQETIEQIQAEVEAMQKEAKENAGEKTEIAQPTPTSPQPPPAEPTQPQQQQQEQEEEPSATIPAATPPKHIELDGDDEDEDDDDFDEDEEKDNSQKLVMDLEEEEEEDEAEELEKDVQKVDGANGSNDSIPKGENKEEEQPMEEKTIVPENVAEIPKAAVLPKEDKAVTLSDTEEVPNVPEGNAKPGKVQKRKSVGATATATANDEERYRLKRRKIKAVGAPKMPLTGYVRYMNDRRETVRKDNPTKTSIEVTKVIAEEWQSLSSDVKSEYLKAAEADKQRYLSELHTFLKSRPDILASELAKNKPRKAEVGNTNTAANTKSSGSNKDKIQTPHENAKSSKETAKEKTQTKDSSSATTSSSQNSEKQLDKNRLKRTPTPPFNSNNNFASSSASAATSVTGSSAASTSAAANATSSTLLTHTPGEIPIFTTEFLEHNKICDIELRSLRKSKTDLEQQNFVLEKHVENMKSGVEKMQLENNELEVKNRLLEIYLEKLKKKLAQALSTLPLPTAPSGATVENIDKYMQDLYKMSTSNSHGPATLNKAKDIIRKLDLQIQL
uniref:HMG box domain-containing protein n=1 Tax=Musca domestica TaxID=7370 RepID=A0A1I8N0V1_MUSDO